MGGGLFYFKSVVEKSVVEKSVVEGIATLRGIFVKKKVIIVGAGFAGVSAALALSKNPNLEIKVIDRRNFHLFQPLLYQVALSGLSPAEIAVPLRSLFRKKPNVDVVLAEVNEIDSLGNRVFYDGKWMSAEYIILACGAKHSYFGNNSWEDVAPGLKNIEQALEIRRRILMTFEMADKEQDPQVQKEMLNFVVIGGGPTGVELAGAIAEIAKKTLVKEFSNVNLHHTEVILVEAGPRVLAAFPPALSARAKKDLEKLGVNVMLNARASDLSKRGVKVGDQFIPSRTLIWAAGVTPSRLTAQVQTELDKGGRAKVQADLSIPQNKNFFVLGDQASFVGKKGQILPGIAPVAIQEGKYMAKVIAADLAGKPRPVFEYFDKGIMATIGRSKAVVSIGSLQFSGLIAWITWVFVHVITLMMAKNRFFVFLQWVWAYFAVGRSARLITHKTWKIYGSENIDIS